MGRHGRRDRGRVRRRRLDRRLYRRRGGGPGARDRTDGRSRGSSRPGRGHRLSRRRHADPVGLRVRGQPRRHVPLHDGGLRSGSRRGQDRPLLRGEPGPLRLAGGTRRSFRPDVLRRDVDGADRHRGPRLLGRRGRLPVQRDRPPRAPGPSGQDEALDGMAAHAAPGRRRHRGRRRRLGGHPGGPARARRRPGGRRPGAALRRDRVAAGAPRSRADRGRLHLQRRHVAPTLPAPRTGNLQGRHGG